MWQRQRAAGSYTDDTAEGHRPRRPRKTALMTAVDLLARQEQSEQKLRDKLARKGYELEEIDKAVARLIEKHYLNDEDADISIAHDGGIAIAFVNKK